MKKPPWGKLPPPGERLPRPVDNREHREGRQTFRSGGSTSSEEEPESSVSTTSDEEDPLRGEPRGRQLCRRIVRSCYRGQWANLVFDKTGTRRHVEEDAPEKGNFVRLTTGKWSHSSWSAPTTPS